MSDCANHQQVVDLASSCGFDIARRWGEPPSQSNQAMVSMAGEGADLQDMGLELLADGDNGSGQNLLSGPCPPPGVERSERLLGRASCGWS